MSGKTIEQLEAENKELRARIRELDQQGEAERKLFEEVQALRLKLSQEKSRSKPRTSIFFSGKSKKPESKPPMDKITQTEDSYVCCSSEETHNSSRLISHLSSLISHLHPFFLFSNSCSQ